jgi:hypothetical protein
MSEQLAERIKKEGKDTKTNELLPVMFQFLAKALDTRATGVSTHKK